MTVADVVLVGAFVLTGGAASVATYLLAPKQWAVPVLVLAWAFGGYFLALAPWPNVDVDVEVVRNTALIVAGAGAAALAAVRNQVLAVFGAGGGLVVAATVFWWLAPPSSVIGWGPALLELMGVVS